MMGGRFVEACRRRGLKINVFKRKMKVLGAKEGLNGAELERTSVRVQIFGVCSG